MVISTQITRPVKNLGEIGGSRAATDYWISTLQGAIISRMGGNGMVARSEAQGELLIEAS